MPTDSICYCRFQCYRPLVTRPGMALVALFGRSAARETMTNVVSGKVRRKFR